MFAFPGRWQGCGWFPHQWGAPVIAVEIADLLKGVEVEQVADDLFRQVEMTFEGEEQVAHGVIFSQISPAHKKTHDQFLDGHGNDIVENFRREDVAAPLCRAQRRLQVLVAILQVFTPVGDCYGHHRDTPCRLKFYAAEKRHASGCGECACCPPQVARRLRKQIRSVCCQPSCR